MWNKIFSSTNKKRKETLNEKQIEKYTFTIADIILCFLFSDKLVTVTQQTNTSNNR